jgi:glycosyltransferase involved in cell wall biosynthesis
MKVLHVAPYYPPERPGGVGVYVARLHRALREGGHASRVWTRAAPGARLDGEDVERIASSTPGWLAALVARTRQAAMFDVVHVHAGEALPLLAALRLELRRPRIVATWHVSYAGVVRALRPYLLEGHHFGDDGLVPLARMLRNAGHRVADRLALPLVDAAVPISRACALELLGARRGTGAEVIHHGVPEPPDATAAEALPHVALLYVGVAGHRKRVQALPFVLQRVRAALPGTRMRIAGFEPGDTPELYDAFAARGLAGAVEWAGVVTPTALSDFYRAADLFVAPAAYEGVPLAVIEAMQHGLPVVATRIAGHSVAIDDGETGFLVPVDDPSAMAAQCIELLRSGPRRRAVGAAAARSARERFAMDRHVRAYLALYERLGAGAA